MNELDLSKLAQQALDVASQATPAPWLWWTSNSFRRLSHIGDGDVAHAYVMPSDHFPDISIRREDMKFIESARTYVPQLADGVLMLVDWLNDRRRELARVETENESLRAKIQRLEEKASENQMEVGYHLLCDHASTSSFAALRERESKVTK